MPGTPKLSQTSHTKCVNRILDILLHKIFECFFFFFLLSFALFSFYRLFFVPRVLPFVFSWRLIKGPTSLSDCNLMMIPIFLFRSICFLFSKLFDVALRVLMDIFIFGFRSFRKSKQMRLTCNRYQFRFKMNSRNQHLYSKIDVITIMW